MQKDYNQINKPILKALQDVKSLDKHKIPYLVMGSLICAASRGGFYRKIEDVDLICDQKDKLKIIKVFRMMGYSSEIKRPKWHLGFYWLELRHKVNKRRLIAVVFGKYESSGGWRLSLNKGFSVYLPKEAVKKTKYLLKGINFIGFPMESHYISLTTIPMLYDNPKRKGDLISIEDKIDHRFINKIYQGKLGFWWGNYCLPNWTILKTLAFMKSLFFSKKLPI